MGLPPPGAAPHRAARGRLVPLLDASLRPLDRATFRLAETYAWTNYASLAARPVYAWIGLKTLAAR